MVSIVYEFNLQSAVLSAIRMKRNLKMRHSANWQSASLVVSLKWWAQELRHRSSVCNPWNFKAEPKREIKSKTRREIRSETRRMPHLFCKFSILQIYKLPRPTVRRRQFSHSVQPHEFNHTAQRNSSWTCTCKFCLPFKPLISFFSYIRVFH